MTPAATRAAIGLASLALLALAPSAWAGKMYKWVDEHGVTHYTQTPPPDTQAEELRPPPPPAVDPAEAKAALDARIKALDEEKASRERAAIEAREDATQEEIRRENCDKARKAVEILEQHRRITIPTADGGSARMTEEQRQAELAERRKQVEEFCTP